MAIEHEAFVRAFYDGPVSVLQMPSLPSYRWLVCILPDTWSTQLLPSVDKIDKFLMPDCTAGWSQGYYYVGRGQTANGAWIDAASRIELLFWYGRDVNAAAPSRGTLRSLMAERFKRLRLVAVGFIDFRRDFITDGLLHSNEWLMRQHLLKLHTYAATLLGCRLMDVGIRKQLVTEMYEDAYDQLTMIGIATRLWHAAVDRMALEVARGVAAHLAVVEEAPPVPERGLRQLDLE